MHPTKTDCGTICFGSSNAHFTAWIWVMSIIDDVNAFLFISWFDKPRGIHWEEHWECNKEPFMASYERHVWTTWQFPRRWMIHILEKYCFNWRQVHDWLTTLMGVGMMHTTNQRIILRRIQERKSFMMNQATPHLGAESSLINSESSNCRGQPRMGTALTSEWWLSHEWANAWKEQRRLWNANKGTLGRWIIKEGGTYISNQVRIHAYQS